MRRVRKSNTPEKSALAEEQSKRVKKTVRDKGKENKKIENEAKKKLFQRMG
jgi:hypothetical protein